MNFNLPVLSIHGAPRSGTSWLGEILNSHPKIAYRFQPLFSYAFKGALAPDSTVSEVDSFLARLLETRDSFVLQEKGFALGQRSDFNKETAVAMALKSVRYHQLIPTLLQHPQVKILCLLRHPCAVIHSWLNSPEFKPEWPPTEWRSAAIKNQIGPEEWNGFEKLQLAYRWFAECARSFPQRVLIIRYEELVTQRILQTRQIFEFFLNSGELPEQTLNFLAESNRASQVGDAYGVFQTTEVLHRWKSDLDPEIQAQILKELGESWTSG